MPELTPRIVSLSNLLAEHTGPAAPELVRPEAEGVVRCLACGHRCRVLKGREGICRVRFNRDGELRVPHGYVSSLAVDPIEKKPFYHALPGSEALSFGMLSCNLHCPFCQNWITSQTMRDEKAIAQPTFIQPERIVELALEHGCPILTSTYNEPLITCEWAVEIFKLGQPHGLIGSFVSNGHATTEVLEFLRPYVPLYKVDLKAFQDQTYRQLGGVLEHVLDTIRRLKELDFWVEIVTLVVPGLNDSDDELRQIADFIASVSADIPWHVTAFHPEYKVLQPPRTPVDTLLHAAELGRKAGLKFVYPGNLPGQVGDQENTRCPSCGRVLIQRYGFQVTANHMSGEHCPDCGARIAGVWATKPLDAAPGAHRPRRPGV
jgi:pyruvate formate lyase activating enzyme